VGGREKTWEVAGDRGEGWEPVTTDSPNATINQRRVCVNGRKSCGVLA
jgi:hypothetical protein